MFGVPGSFKGKTKKDHFGVGLPLMQDKITSGKNWISSSLAGVAQWIECRPENQKVAGSIHSQGTCLGCGPGTQ